MKSVIRTATTPVVISLWAASAFTEADTIKLQEDDQLSGKILSISDGTINIKSALTNKLLEIKQEKLDKISFKRAEPNTHTYSELVTLKGGDIIPCSLLSLNESELKAEAWFSEPLSIPRDHLSTIEFGIQQKKFVFQDDANLHSWETLNGKWTTSQKKYECQGVGFIAKKVPTPQNALISYDIEWDQSLHLACHIFAKTADPISKHGGYEITINNSSNDIKIKRHQGEFQATKDVFIKSIELRPEQKKSTLNMRFNRDSGEISIILDGQLIGTAYDSPPPQEGDYIILQNKKNQPLRLSNLKIAELPSIKDTRRRLHKLSGTSDLLIDNEANELKGDIRLINKDISNNKLTISFYPNNQTSSSQKEIKIPEHRISTLYFGKPEDEEPQILKSDQSLSIKMFGTGIFQLKKIQLVDGNLTGEHASLGNISINTNAILSIKQQAQASEQTSPEPSSEILNQE